MTKLSKARVRPRTYDALRKAMRQMIADQQVAQIVWGTVSAVTGSVTFTQNGTTNPMPHVETIGYVPTVGDVAMGIRYGSDLVLVGAKSGGGGLGLAFVDVAGPLTVSPAAVNSHYAVDLSAGSVILDLNSPVADDSIVGLQIVGWAPSNTLTVTAGGSDTVAPNVYWTSATQMQLTAADTGALLIYDKATTTWKLLATIGASAAAGGGGGVFEAFAFL